MKLLKKRKVALALGGGAARGFANIGVLKVLEREHIPIDLIIGSSIGSFVGAAYSVGIPTYRMEEAALRFSVDTLTDFSLSRMSVLKGKKLEKIIHEFTDGKGFEDAEIPIAITTTD
ncbi:MAG: patatin-like phospholipase family protein, partial [Candidatus Omnitrophota bacterium]